MKTISDYFNEIDKDAYETKLNYKHLFECFNALKYSSITFEHYVNSGKLWVSLQVDSFYDVLPLLEIMDNIHSGCLSYDDDNAKYRAYSFGDIVILAYPKSTSETCKVVEIPSTIKKFKCS
jgi:hypothetical protein